MVSSWQLALLVVSAFIAGFVDAIAGGGGLIQVPALFVFGPAGAAPAALLGTSKLVSFCGTSAAAVTYLRRVNVFRPIVIACGAFAFLGSLLGAAAVARMSQESFRPVALVLLTAVALYVALRPALGDGAENKPRGRILDACAVGGALGFYDGFFGPGTGSFLIFSFVTFFGFRFLDASAAAKFVNVLTNVSALVYFAWHGLVNYTIGVPMAAANVAGGICGSLLATKLGSSFVRRVFLVVVAAFIVKLAFDVFR